MRLILNIEKRYAYAIIGLIVVLTGLFLVNAAVNQNLGWHPKTKFEEGLRIILNGNE